MKGVVFFTCTHFTTFHLILASMDTLVFGGFGGCIVVMVLMEKSAVFGSLEEMADDDDDEKGVVSLYRK